MSVAYFCRFAELLGDADIVDLVIPFTAERRIIAVGGFSTSFTITDAALGAQVAKIVPSKTVVYVHRGNDIFGCYIIWSKKISSDTSGKVTCSLQGSTLESYFYRRILGFGLTYTAFEQTAIASNLIAALMGGTSTYTSSSDIDLIVAATPSTVTRDREYLATDSSTIGDLLEELANVDDGFEYTVDAAVTPTGRQRTIRITYPTLVGSGSTIQLDEPGDILSWTLTDDATAGWTRFRTRGASVTDESTADSVPIVSDWVESDAYLSSGYPLLDKSYDYSTVTETATLDEYAAWWAANRSGPLRVISLVVDPNRLFDRGFSSFSLGCSMVVNLCNPAFPKGTSGEPGLTVVSRCIGYDLDVSTTGADTLTMVVESDFDPTEVV